jgi:hypothetical protein
MLQSLESALQVAPFLDSSQGTTVQPCIQFH